MRYLSILAIWTALSFLPLLGGDFYDAHFHLFQSAISLILLISVRYLSKEIWVPEYCVICVIQILNNFGELLLDFDPGHYNNRLMMLNYIEMAILIGWGGTVELLRVYRAYGTSRSRPDSPDRHLAVEGRNTESG